MAEADAERARGMHLLYSELWSDRLLGAEVLGAVGGREAVDALAVLIAEATREEDTAVLQAAIRSLKRIGDPRAIPALSRIANWQAPLSLHEEQTRDAARAALTRLGRE